MTVLGLQEFAPVAYIVNYDNLSASDNVSTSIPPSTINYFKTSGSVIYGTPKSITSSNNSYIST